MRFPWVNTLLLILMIAQLLTGVVGLGNGVEWLRWVLQLHAIGGYAVLALLIWKGIVIVDAYVRRRRPFVPRMAFATLTVLLLFILATGLLWIYGGYATILGFSLMTVHALLSIILLALLVWHTWALRYVFRIPASVDRRAFFRLAGSGLAGWIFWRGTESSLTQLNAPGATRRFTGSYEINNPLNTFPSVSWLLDNPPPVDISQWQLVIDGEVERALRLSYDQLLALMQDEIQATIDCTGGWYSTQIWHGVYVSRLLREAGVRSGAQSVSVEAVSGYWRRFALDQIFVDRYLLATHVAGQPLIHGHGFPARWIAIDHRGFDWVKWVHHIEVTRIPAAMQPPLPLR